jgi:hypothetical protein
MTCSMSRREPIRWDGSSSRPNRLLCDGKTRNNQWSVEQGRHACAGAASAGRPTAFLPLGRAHVLPGTLRPSKWLRPSLRAASGQDWTGLFEHSRIFFVWLSVIHMRINRQNIAIIQQSHQENGSATLPIGDWAGKVSREHF